MFRAMKLLLKWEKLNCKVRFSSQGRLSTKRQKWRGTYRRVVQWTRVGFLHPVVE